MTQSTLAFNASPTASTFNFGAHAVRIIIRDGEPWFVAKDVCDTLGYSNSRDALAKHLDGDERGVANSDTLGGKQALTIINESGLYALVLRSRKPEARKFAKWVTGEVLPSIRKTGSYTKTAVPATTLRGRRWLISTDSQGAESITPLADDEFISSLSRLARGIATGDTLLSTAELVDLASACNQRLVLRLGNPAIVLTV